MTKTVVVAGAGVVGLSIARAVALHSGFEVFLLELNKRVGMETSSRNSEVIHAGIYYRKDSLKAKLCLRGRDMLYDYCKTKQVPHLRCGKLIVAQTHQTDQLSSIARRGIANGVSDLRLITKEEANKLEPEVECTEALFSPSTGIIDSHTLMQTLEGDAQNHGAMIAFGTSVDFVDYDSKSKRVRVSTSSVATGEVDVIECDYFVNATGIFAPNLVRAGGTNTGPFLPKIPSMFAKGTYFKLRDNSRPFSHLVYPIPEIGGLGVHATVDLEGNVRFGPDVEYVNSLDYTPDESKAESFAARVRDYWPRVTASNLIADYCGIRPKIDLGGKVYDDFFIAGEKLHGMKGVIHLCGIESPGLTSCLAIAETILELVEA